MNYENELYESEGALAGHRRQIEMQRKLVVIVSPCSGDDVNREFNRQYAIECLDHSLRNGEYPFASHLLYTQVLDDNDEEQRAAGIAAGHAWMSVSNTVAVYTDRGISQGMMADIEKASELGKRIEFRSFR